MAGDAVKRFKMMANIVIALGVIGTVAALVLVQRFGDTYRTALDVTVDGAALTSDASTQAASLSSELAELTRTAAASAESAQTSLDTFIGATRDLGVAATTNLADGVTGTASIADRVAGAIERIEDFIPGDRESAAEDLREIADGLEPVPDQLRALGETLAGAADDLDATATALQPIPDQLAAIATSIDASTAAFTRTAGLAATAEQEARDARDHLSFDLWMMRLLVIAGGCVVIALAVLARGIAGLQGAVDVDLADGLPAGIAVEEGAPGRE
jgi:hypothetical protein